MKTIQLKIQGMSCGHCVGRVRSALGQVEGVEVEKVDVGSARVALVREGVSEDAVLAALGAAGYAASVVEGNAPSVALRAR